VQVRYWHDPPQQSPRLPHTSPQSPQFDVDPIGVHAPEQQFDPEAQGEPQVLQFDSSI